MLTATLSRTSIFKQILTMFLEKDKGYVRNFQIFIFQCVLIFGVFLYMSVIPEAMAPTDLGRSVNPISTRRGRLCPPHQYCHPWIFRPSYSPAIDSQKIILPRLNCEWTKINQYSDYWSLHCDFPDSRYFGFNIHSNICALKYGGPMNMKTKVRMYKAMRKYVDYGNTGCGVFKRGVQN